MASVNTPMQDRQDDPQSWQATRVDPSDTQRLRQALALLLTGRGKRADAAVDQFLFFMRQQNALLDHLWTISRGDQAKYAAMIVINPGRTAMIFASPAVSGWQGPVMTQLVNRIIDDLDAGQVTMVQALLDPGQEHEAAALLEAKFQRLATLAYLQRKTAASHRAGHGGPVDFARLGLRIAHWSADAATRQLFERAILDSYEQTLDCPGLLGLRTIQDIIIGHQSTGVFDPSLWSVYLHGQTPAAVVLLSDLPGQCSLELVYLGVSMAFRGSGLGRKLMQHALVTAEARGAQSMVLAVDEHNTPAMALYQTLGFHSTARKQALIRKLPPRHSR
ncbi:MAG: GNAT family N-acetyltransferase [Phycisphaeraceae bacterium]|nr:GNAT family N-acetyltransferase [Phycisphaeraceae bacterium]